MLSRAGKYTEEQHMILRSQDEILSGQPKKRFVPRAASTDNLKEKAQRVYFYFNNF
jgi:hypothetical protein